MASDFAKDRTIKLCGVSQFMRELIVEFFQNDKNSSGIQGDVDKVYMCPDARDCVLVEFSENVDNIDSYKQEVDISGSVLKAEPYTKELKGHPTVIQIWSSEDQNIDFIEPEQRSNAAGTDQSAGKGRSRCEKVKDDKRKRQDKFDKRRHIPEGDSISDDEDWEDLEDSVRKSVLENRDKSIKLEGETGDISGPWNAVRNLFKSFFFWDVPSETHGKSNDVVHTKTHTESFERGRDIQVNWSHIRYIMAYHYNEFEKLDSVSSEIHFIKSAEVSANERLMKAIPLANASKQFGESMNDFIQFYQDLNQKMYAKCIDVEKMQSPAASLNETFKKASAQFSVIVSSTAKDIAVCGEKDKVEKAVRFIEEEVKGYSRSGAVSGGATGRKSIKEKFPKRKLVCDVSSKVKLFVYQGDITEEDADAIVNPANEDLHHSGGAAEAIVRKGGRVIQDESDQVLKMRESRLRPGDVEVTTAGALPCKFIVHAVGPRYFNHTNQQVRKFLRQAVTNSLVIASKSEAKSIAIPAISSGIFGVPLATCVEVLFVAAEDFVTKGHSANNITEIRFVNNDARTVKAFEEEMKKRYKGAVNSVDDEDLKETSATGTKASDAPLLKAEFAGSVSSDTRDKLRKNSKDTASDKRDSSKTPLSYANVASKGVEPSSSDKRDAEIRCTICRETVTNPKTLNICKHTFCTECIELAFKYRKQCPNCSQVYGALTGDQPDGTMRREIDHRCDLPGYKKCGTIAIYYTFYNGRQGANHPNPGKPYTGTSRRAYLPNNEKGQKVFRLLKKAFDQKLVFTIGRSATTGTEDCVIWNDIHHKTNTYGGQQGYGYPDATYLDRVLQELAAKGITE